MRFIFDENTSNRVVQALNHFHIRCNGVIVEFHSSKSLFGQGASDPYIFSNLRDDDLLITLDVNQSRNQQERLSIIQNNLKIVCLRYKGVLTPFRMCRVIMGLWNKIVAFQNGDAGNVLSIRNKDIKLILSK